MVETQRQGRTWCLSSAPDSLGDLVEFYRLLWGQGSYGKVGQRSSWIHQPEHNHVRPVTNASSNRDNFPTGRADCDKPCPRLYNLTSNAVQGRAHLLSLSLLHLYKWPQNIFPPKIFGGPLTLHSPSIYDLQSHFQKHLPLPCLLFLYLLSRLSYISHLYHPDSSFIQTHFVS